MPTATFFSIPLEIRHEIYQLLLLARLNYCHIDHPHTPDVIKLHPAIISTCHQAYEEAYPVLYKENRWVMMETNGCTEHDGPGNEDIQPAMPAIKLRGRPFLQENLILTTQIRGFHCTPTCHLLKVSRMILPLSSRALSNIGQNLWAYAVISDLHVTIRVAGLQIQRYRLKAEVLEALDYITDCKYA
ncbi:hypothetical protein MMC14_010812, partial [Varicellaria rhodocarpa]|nr:hypothetical protein [Varicellaria rhodocarpa]